MVSHMDVLTEILIQADQFDKLDKILGRKGTRMDRDKFIKLDLSKLGLSELPENINSLKGIELLDLRHNNLKVFPKQIMELNETEILLDGNPVDSVEMVAHNLKQKPKATTTKRGDANVLYPEKICSWCERASGYHQEIGRLSGEWGGTNHYVQMLICLSCGHIDYIYQKRV